MPGVRALRGHVARWRRGRGVARPAARLRGGQALPAAAEHPRRSLLPVREQHFDEFQSYARAGYVVVYSNPRGSSGYSEEWGRAIRGPVDGGLGWGSRDYDDLMAVVDTALQQFDFIDPDRLGVMGGSYGGYMTTWMVGHTDRFKTACSERASTTCSRVRLGGLRVVPPGVHGCLAVRGRRALPRAVAHDVRGQDHDAAAHPPLRERPALSDRAGRAPVHDPPPARP